MEIVNCMVFQEHFNLNIGKHTVNDKSYMGEKLSGFSMNCKKVFPMNVLLSIS